MKAESKCTREVKDVKEKPLSEKLKSQLKK